MTTRFGNKVYPHSDQMDTNTAEIILISWLHSLHLRLLLTNILLINCFQSPRIHNKWDFPLRKAYYNFYKIYQARRKVQYIGYRIFQMPAALLRQNIFFFPSNIFETNISFTLPLNKDWHLHISGLSVLHIQYSTYQLPKIRFSRHSYSSLHASFCQTLHDISLDR